MASKKRMQATTEQDQSFGKLLDWHLGRGTHADGSPAVKGVPWGNKDFARAVGTKSTDTDKSERTVRNWRNAVTLPSPADFRAILLILFGTNEDYAEWKTKLTDKYHAARAEASDGKAPDAPLNPSVPTKPPWSLGRDVGLKAVDSKVQRPDWFAVLLAAFVLGAGAYLSTYPVDVIRAAGIALMATSLWGLIIWFLWERRRKVRPSILLFGGITFAALAVASLAAWYFWPRPAAEQPTPPQGGERKQTAKPYYSEADRANLNDLCRELAAFLRKNGGDGGGDGVWKKLVTLNNDWVALRGRDATDLSQLDRDLTDARHSIVLFLDYLYGDNGVFKRYDAYHEELEKFFGREYFAQIRTLRSDLEEFGNSVAAIEAEQQPAARQRLFTLLEPGRDKYAKGINRFQKDLFEITQRVETFRKQL